MMFWQGQKINGWEIMMAKRIDEDVCVPTLKHEDRYLVKTGPDEHVIVRVPLGTESKNTLRRAIEKELLRIRSFEGKTLIIYTGWK